MIRPHWALFVGACLAVASAVGEEAPPAGTVKTSRGTVTIERAGTRLPAPVGTSVHPADTLRTGPDGSVGITLRDQTLLSAGPNSTLTLDRYAFDSTTHAGAMAATLGRGTLAVATGKLARQAPEKVEFRTPTAVLGVRGTEFAVEVARGGDE